jgi:hypothetical protein
MYTTQKLVQAYHQAPWRIQVQWIALFLLALIGSALVIGFYLKVSAEATAAGLEIERSLEQKTRLELKNADLRNELAQKTTSLEMAQRAQKMGFKPVDPAKVKYIVVPGYTERQNVNLLVKNKTEVITQPLIQPAYTQSMWEWLYEGALQLGQYSGGEK